MVPGASEAVYFGKPLATPFLEPTLKHNGKIAVNLAPVSDFRRPFIRNQPGGQKQCFFKASLDGKTLLAALILQYWLFKLSMAFVV